jgi:hypothetical protein
MPLTTFQKQVLEVILANLGEASHFAGGIVLHSPDDSVRLSPRSLAAWLLALDQG